MDAMQTTVEEAVRDQVWCGGRWPASVPAEMAEVGRG